MSKRDKWERTDEYGRRTRVRRGFTRSLRRELEQITGRKVVVGHHWRAYHAELGKILFRNATLADHPSFEL